MFKKPEPGSFAEAGTIADEIHCATSLKSLLYDDIYSRINVLLGGNDSGRSMFDDITTDWYDNSLELKGVIDGTEIKPEVIQAIYEMGFDRFWVNFIDGSEKYFFKPDHVAAMSRNL